LEEKRLEAKRDVSLSKFSNLSHLPATSGLIALFPDSK
jgi:hypothetical protein